MNNRFPQLKSQEEIDRNEQGFFWFTLYLVMNGILTIVFDIWIIIIIFQYMMSK